jgi:hypothetical protein
MGISQSGRSPRRPLSPPTWAREGKERKTGRGSVEVVVAEARGGVMLVTAVVLVTVDGSGWELRVVPYGVDLYWADGLCTRRFASCAWRAMCCSTTWLVSESEGPCSCRCI